MDKEAEKLIRNRERLARGEELGLDVAEHTLTLLPANMRGQVSKTLVHALGRAVEARLAQVQEENRRRARATLDGVLVVIFLSHVVAATVAWVFR